MDTKYDTKYNMNIERYFDIAEYFYEHFRDTLRYNENDSWSFDDKPCDEAKIHMMIVKELATDLLNIAAKLSNRAASLMSNERDTLIRTSSNLMVIATKLQDKEYRDKIIQELVIIYKVLA